MQYLQDDDPALSFDVLPGDDWWSGKGGWKRRGADHQWHWLADPGDDHPDDGKPRPEPAP